MKNKIIKRRLKICNTGCKFLKVFFILLIVSTIYLIFGYCGKIGNNGGITKAPLSWILQTFAIIGIESILFWIGAVMVYITSVQIGIKYRVLGVVFLFVPIVNLAVLLKIIRIADKEVKYENLKYYKNLERKDKKICQTKYPLLLVHGVFFRDSKLRNYWGRIPYELKENGAEIFYANQNSAASVADSSKEIVKRIQEIVEKTGCQKVNIIAHSKGGLDSRMAVASGDIEKNVASLTTINTPHRGCEFADYLLNKIPQSQAKRIEKMYNTVAKKLGDTQPDFMSAVRDLTFENCSKNNEVIKDSENVYYQSVGSKLNKATSGSFPLNFSYKLVKHFDGANDGLVGEKSFEFGEKYIFLTNEGKRGISHGDVIDLNRENIDGFDVREFYVELVSNLKDRGF